VVDSLLLPVGQVKVKTIDPVSGLEIFNIRNTTDITGAYELVVAPGSYDLLLIPQRGSVWLPRHVGGVLMTADTTLPDLPLDSGALISGTVIDGSGNPADAVDLDHATTIQGSTPVHPAGAVTVEVIHPGSTPVAAPGSFTFIGAALDPAIRDATEALSLRVDAGAVATPGLVYYLVH
jgi:hypothetical protein